MNFTEITTRQEIEAAIAAALASGTGLMIEAGDRHLRNQAAHLVACCTTAEGEDKYGAFQIVMHRSMGGVGRQLRIQIN